MERQEQNIIICGGGFAGLAAADAVRAACRPGSGVTVRLFDVNAYTTMVPALPDLAGGRYAARYLTGGIEGRIDPAVRFHREAVTAADFEAQTVTTPRGVYRYDYLVMAAGSTTEFYGFDEHRDVMHTLESLNDAVRIRDAFRAYQERCAAPTAVVVGGGYTGLELACNLRLAGRPGRSAPRVCVVERQDDIVSFMPDWVRAYMRRQAGRRGLELITGAALEHYDGRSVTLSNGRRLDDVFLCWAAGTRFAIDALRGDAERIKDGRLKVDAALRLPRYPNVFAAGDAAAIEHAGRVLRKAVNFSRDSGRQAGRNLVRVLRGEPPEPFRPVDLGWVIPFGDVGVGVLFGRLGVRGRLPLALHYAMCGLRNFNWRNRVFLWGMSVRSVLGRAVREGPGGAAPA